MDKKGAMQLSINMIVVLIIAVVVLGLALGFINGMFSRVSETFEGKTTQAEEPASASAANPITMSSSSGHGTLVSGAPGEDLILKFSLYCANSTNNCINVNLTGLDCAAALGDIDTKLINITKQTSGVSSAIVPIVKTAVKGKKYLCRASFTSTGGQIDQTIDFTTNVI